MAHLLPSPKMQFFDLNGDPLSGGKVNAYEAGTSTRKATYTTAAATVANANPVILNSRGEANIFWSTGSYKITLTDSLDNEIYTVDNVTLSATGAAGASFRAGSGVPSDALGSDGDRYLRSDTGQIYLKGSGVYSVETTMSLPGTAVTNTPSGNLAAVTVQNALNELQSDIDTRATDTDLTTAEGRITTLELALPAGDDYLQIQETVSPPATPSAGYKRIYADTDGKVYQVNSAGVVTELGGAGGGGGGGIEVEFFQQADAPILSYANSSEVFEFEDAIDQYLYAEIRVPESYVAGGPIALIGNYYTSVTSGNVLLQSLVTLIRNGTDAVTSTTNQRTSTNAAATVPGSTNVLTEVTLDLTSAIGEVNAVAVSPGDRLKIRITRNTTTDTAAASVFMMKKGWEVTID